MYVDFRYIGKEVEGTTPYIRATTRKKVLEYIEDENPQMYKELISKTELGKYLDATDSDEDAKQVINDQYGVPKVEVDGNEVTSMLKDIQSTLQTFSNTRLETAMIEGIVEKGREIAVEDLKEQLKAELSDFIKEQYGVLPQVYNIQLGDKTTTITGLVHNTFPKILKLVTMGLPVMLTGGAGAGKNHMLEQVSKALELDFYYTSTINQEYKLTGFIDGGGTFHETEFYNAFSKGGVFMLDEIDASIPECLVILNGAIANGYFDFPNGRINAHKDFRVVCAGNTVGLGADMVYTGRNVLDGATLDRFVLVEIDYDKEIEQTLCPDDELRTFLHAVRSAVKKLRLSHIVGMRSLKYSYELLQEGFDKEFILSSVVFKGLGMDDINLIRKEVSIYEWANYIKK